MKVFLKMIVYVLSLNIVKVVILINVFKELKKHNRTLEEDQIVEWLIQILIAVQYMHKSRILHRDLKARNIFLKSNKVKIGDFGISRVLVGTMEYAHTFTGTPYVCF